MHTKQSFERFDDFTLASSWERFISDIEAVCRLWMADGRKNLLDKGAVCITSNMNLYKVKSELTYSMKSYCLEYYFQISTDGQVLDWNDVLHDLQLSFGVKEFLVIAPVSSSGVVLDAPEATKLLSSVAVALSNCSSLWPAFVPVHVPSRKAYIGIQNMGTVLTRRFEADLIASQVPIRLMHLEGLYELFVSKFAFCSVDFSTGSFKVHFTMKLTYRTTPDDEEDDLHGDDSEIKESDGEPENVSHIRAQWDDDCPWAEWYSSEDLVKGFELVTVWLNKMVENSSSMAELENASSHEADNWFLIPVLSQILDVASKGNFVGFASQLRLLVNALDISFKGQFIEDFVSVEKLRPDNLKSSTTVPPPTVMDRVLKDLFHEGLQTPDYSKGEHKNSRSIKGAPLDSLFSQFCLHSLWFGDCNIRAVAVLWIEFVREVRWCWEETELLPRMQTDGGIDLSTCLIHQKLQMLAVCIEKKRRSDRTLEDMAESTYPASSHTEGDLARSQQTQTQVSAEQSDLKGDSHLSPDDKHNSGSTATKNGIGLNDDSASADTNSSEKIRRGSAGLAGSMMLLNSRQRMHVPHTQDPPIMTEDMHEERLRAIEVFGSAFSISGQLEKDILSSDMSAFKAANPDSVFEDFIRWHSPGDWETSANQGGLKVDWPPTGGLSTRMSEHGNSWRQIWNDVPALPASEQKPLLDPNREGEKILHYLETIRPHQLLQQMVCTAFRSSADTLNQTSFGNFKQMKTKITQLYATIASTLKPLQGNDLADKDEIIDDMKRLSVVFEHVEKLLIFAASIHRKLSSAPRLSRSIFDDYFDFYLPRMGTSTLVGEDEKKFEAKQRVRQHERVAVESLFKHPTANQSWRNVLSMGNLLNGHEPILREIIFTKHANVGRNQYGSGAPGISKEDEIETHRMYICGTSNDLRVALSVTSFD
ncbi:hypothetical protein ACHQM5_013584 [Ranunculus cassubicifolius]